jgi:molybdate transport system substrate-binding protein
MGRAIAGVTSMAADKILAELGKQFAARTGIAVAFESLGGVVAARRVRDGLATDIVALASDVVRAMETEGVVRAGSRVDYARSGISLAVPTGAAHPTIATEADVRAAMMAARCVGYSTGPSGVYIKTVWERWGVAIRSAEAPPAVPVAALLARGDADLGLQQLSELLGQPGIDIVGPLPDPIQKITVFSAGIAKASTDPDAAAAFLQFLASEDAFATIERFGMAPVGKS